METLATWFEHVAEDHGELLRELLDDGSPFFQLPEEVSQPAGPAEEQTIEQLISSVHSAPTIQDIEDALSMKSQNDQSQSISQARMSVFDRGMNKIENNKYTLKLKSCGNGMLDDGYKWRKYGQKSIKNSPYPRSYYRCTNSRCNAKKQVERSCEDHDTLIITYEGLHFHFAYPSYLLLNQSEDDNPTTKKPKRTEPEAHETLQTITELAQLGPAQACGSTPLPNRLDNDYLVTTGRQGLLEDVVPFMIRNPSHHNATSYSSSSSSSYHSPISSSCPSWSPDYSSSYLDVGMHK